jgi:bacterial/archaeal transporter family protein
VTWQVFLLMSILLGSLSSIFQKKMVATDGVDPVAFSAAFQLIIAVFFGLTLLFKGFRLDLNSLPAVSFLLMIILYSAASIFRFSALKTTEASEFAVLAQVAPVVTVILAVVFLKESFLIKQVIGLALVILSVILVSLKDRIKIKFSKGEIVAILAGIAYGAAFANDAYLLQKIDVWTLTFLSFLIPGLVAMGLANKKMGTIKKIRGKRNVLGFLLASALYGLAAFFVYTAYQSGHNAAQISSIYQISTILVVILAVIFLGERDNLVRKFAAAVLSVIGVILLR